MIYCILGQTASGKTSLAIEVARRFSLPVISADAYQCYKMMQIGTDKPKPEEIAGLKFYFTDAYEPDASVSVYLFQKEMRKVLDSYLKEGKDVLVVGGTFLYVRALFYDYDFEEEKNTRQEEYDGMELSELQELLRSRDKDVYGAIDNKNKRRVVRALVRLDEGKKTEDGNKAKGTTSLYPVEFLQILVDKEEGNRKIDRRVDRMFEEGFPEEVKHLASQYPADLRSFQAIGYKESLAALKEHEEIGEDVKELIKVHTHQYAKKQRTFLRNQFPEIRKGSKEEIRDYLISVLTKEEAKHE